MTIIDCQMKKSRADLQVPVSSKRQGIMNVSTTMTQIIHGAEN